MCWEEKRNIPFEERAGNACERWTHIHEDVHFMKHIGIKAHRFSIEWSKVEPEKGIFDHEAMQHYIEYIREMINHGITPIPTLFHHTWPLWFEYPEETKQGTRGMAFEDARNIADFVEFALYVIRALEKAGLLNEVRMWLTFNEPITFALSGYVHGSMPPGKKADFKTAGVVAKNMLDAHIKIYDEFKKIDPSLQISFAHAVIPFYPYNPWNPIERYAAKFIDYLTNDVALEYFKTGVFRWFTKDISWLKIFTGNVRAGIFTEQYNANACHKLDFIGLNYYSNILLKMISFEKSGVKWFKQKARPFEKLADGYDVPKVRALYAEGLYHSIKRVSSLGVPIIITENGFAAKTDALRDEYIKKHLYAVHKAIQDGYDVRGYLFWTLMDCFGWDSKHSHHGIYAVDFTTQMRTLKPNAQFLVDVMNNHVQQIAFQ